SVRPDEPQHLARRHPERQPADGDDAVITLPQVRDLEHSGNMRTAPQSRGAPGAYVPTVRGPVSRIRTMAPLGRHPSYCVSARAPAAPAAAPAAAPMTAPFAPPPPNTRPRIAPASAPCPTLLASLRLP